MPVPEPVVQAGQVVAPEPEPVPTPKRAEQLHRGGRILVQFVTLFTGNPFKKVLPFAVAILLLAIAAWIRSLYVEPRSARPSEPGRQTTTAPAIPAATNRVGQEQARAGDLPKTNAEPGVITSRSNVAVAAQPTLASTASNLPPGPRVPSGPPAVTPTNAPMADVVVTAPPPKATVLPLTNAPPAPVAPARVMIQSLPPGATASVVVENQRQSRATPATFEGLRPGSYTFEIMLEGYRLNRQEVSLSPGTNCALMVNLEKLQSLVRVLAEPAGAQVYVDGQLQPAWKTGSALTLEVGVHQFQVTLPGHRPLTTNIQIGAQSTLVDLGSLPRQTGVMAITSSPVGARVRLNGTDTGKTTPWQLEGAPGLYKLNLQLDGYQPADGAIQLQDGDNVVSNFFLARLMNTRKVAIVSSPLGAKIKIDGQERPEKTMAQFDLTLGRHQIEVTKPGFLPYTYSLDLAAGDKLYALTLVLGSEGIPALIAACERRAAELGGGGAPFSNGAQADEELRQWEEWAADHPTEFKNSKKLRNAHAQLLTAIRARRPAQ